MVQVAIMNRTVEESHTEKGIFEQGLKRDKGTVMWESWGGGFQREETAGAENEAKRMPAEFQEQQGNLCS